LRPSHKKGGLMNDELILVPDKKEVVIGDRKYQVGRLSLTQEFKIGRFFSKTILSSQEKLKSIKENTEKGTSNTDDILGILELLNEDEVCRLFSIILKEDDIEFLKSNINMPIIIEIIADILENYNIDGVKKNIQRIGSLLLPKKAVV